MEQRDTSRVRVRLILTGGLAAFARDKVPEHELDLPAGSRLSDALRAVGIPLHEVMGAVSNGTLKQHDHTLSDGEEFEVLPVIAGG
ncbi:MAG TPA: MoaD/ThiS family protein [Firmicutes bacterium]|nr:MoaD/ThiS family protein [Bacillota bacterium]